MSPTDLGPAALLINSGARSGAGALDAAASALGAAGLEVGRRVLVDGTSLDSEVHSAVEAGHRLVVVGGGDGTIGTAAGVMADLPRPSRPVLGVLPLGTANDFARTLDLPDDLEEACLALATGKVVDLDLGRANGAPFLNAASIGLSVGVAQALRPGLKKLLGPAAYPVATLLAYRHHRPFRARLEFPDGDHDTLQLDHLLQLAVGNGRHYGGGNTIAPDAGVDDHLLDVDAIRQGRLRDHLSIARLLKDGSLIEHEKVEHRVTRSVHVTTYDGPGGRETHEDVNLDGEIAASTPVLFEVERNVLDVVVPSHVTDVTRDVERPDTQGR